MKGKKMSVQDQLKTMTNEITTCLSGSLDDDISWDKLAQICTIMSNCANKISLVKDSTVLYGRYLVFENDLFNVQLDVFSKNYIGAPHNHETWGVMCGISGELGICDYTMMDGKLNQIRAGILRSGSALGFMKESDWHSTETFGGDQVASFHVYGREFNLEDGYRFSDSVGIEKYRRGTLNYYSDNTHILKLEN